MTENDRLANETAAVNCQADSAIVGATSDKIESANLSCASTKDRGDLIAAAHAAALELAASGFHVFPLDHPAWPRCRGAHHPAAPCDGKRGKHPLGPWKQQATTDPELVGGMFRDGPFNIGVACGPSGLLVVDEDGPRGLAAFAANSGLVVPETRTVRTGRGSHFLFRHDHDIRSLGNAEGLLSDYDVNIRGVGGFVVGPGSLHEFGTSYVWHDAAVPIADLPSWLLDAVRTKAPRPASRGGARASAGSSGVIPAGRRHEELVSYAGRLVNSGQSVEELQPAFLERFKDCVQPPGVVPGARYEDPACSDAFTETEALTLLADVAARYGTEDTELEEWRAATPLPLIKHRDLTAFPLDALPGPLAQMVAAVAEFTQTDPAMAGTTCLAVVAATAGGRVMLEVRPGWREPVNLYTATVAGPGERKSAVQAVMSAPLQLAEMELTERVRAQRLEASMTKDVAAKAADKARDKAGKAHPDERAEFLREAINALQAAEAIEVPVLPRLLADDITPERCAGLLAEQGGKLAVISAEGGIFDIIAGRYSAGIPALDVWLKGHSGDQLRVDRQSRETQFIANPALTLSLMIQPSVLTSIAVNKDFRGRGLLARFLYAVPHSKVGKRLVGTAPVPPDVQESYTGLIKTLALTLADWQDPAVVQLSPEASELLDDLARCVEPQLGQNGDLQHIADWGSKYVGAVARISALLHVADHPRDGWRLPVQAVSVSNAIKLGDYFKQQALYAFDQMKVDPSINDADYLVSVIRRVNKLSISRRDLHVASSRSRFGDVTSLDAPIKVLEVHGYLLRQPAPVSKGRGRPPSPTWLVHPAVLEGSDDS